MVKKEAMSEHPVVKFSPFEALLIGEKNKVAKRKPMKNTIFLTHLTYQRRQFNLRELFDVKDEVKDNGVESQQGKNKKKKANQKKYMGKKGNSCKHKSQKKIVKQNKITKDNKKDKKTQSNKVRFKPDFRFKETLEERIVHKIQKRKKKLKTNLVSNGILSQLRKPNPNRHCLRGKNGKFIRKDEQESDNSLESKTKSLTDYLKHLYMKKSSDLLKTDYEESTKNGLPKIKFDSETILNDISIQYYHNLFSKEFGFPAFPKNMEATDFDDDDGLMDILYESVKIKDGNVNGDPVEEQEESDCGESDMARRRKGLKMYERKRTDKSDCSIRELFNNSTKENQCINKSCVNVNKLIKTYDNNIDMKGRRNDSKYLIDERPTNDDHLISENKFRSLFYKTACGSETYLGNLTKTVLLNSTFGRLPDIS